MPWLDDQTSTDLVGTHGLQAIKKQPRLKTQSLMTSSVNFMKGDATPWLPPLRYLFRGYDVCYLCRVAGADAKQNLVMDML